MPREVILCRVSGLRHISEDEVVRALPTNLALLPREVVHVDLRELIDEVGAGFWATHESRLREHARDVLQLADSKRDPELHFFGIAEIPHVLTLAAHIGDQRQVVPHEYDRDEESWEWPEDERKSFETLNLPPEGHAIQQPGIAVLRVEVSQSITDADVLEAVGTEHLAHVTVRLAGATPAVARIRSAADVDAVAREVRRALARIRAFAPELLEIHLFVAAPMSVVFAVGRELSPRNSPPVQTYRYREVPGEPSQRPAILITGSVERDDRPQLSARERDEARKLREREWKPALKTLEGYALDKRSRADGVRWFDDLLPKALADASPFPFLPRVDADSIPSDAVIAAEPYEADAFQYNQDDRTWHLNDRLVLGLRDAAASSGYPLSSLIPLFLLHEYVHGHHVLTRDTAVEVGKFPNVLENVDYSADVYALAHGLDMELASEDAGLSEEDQKLRLAHQVDRIIRSLWSFETPGNPIWQVRRVRRYLNWYWRHIQVLRAPTLIAALRVVARHPCIELAGVFQTAYGRYHNFDLSRRDQTSRLELGVVLEDGRLYRHGGGAAADLEALTQALITVDDGALKHFFRALYDRVRPQGGVF